MLNATWSWSDIHHPLPSHHLTTAIKNLGSAIVDDGAVAALTEIFKRGWMFDTAAWRLTEFIAARLLQSDHLLTKDPNEATLVLLNGNTTGAERYLQQQRAAKQPPYQHHHFGIVPYGKGLTLSLLSEYRLDDPDRVLARYARAHPGDVTVPYLTELNPHGPDRLSSLELLYNKPRRWLVSFVGSAYRPGEPKAALTMERYDLLRRLVECNWRYMQQGPASFKDRELQALLTSDALAKQPGLNLTSLLLIPMTGFPNGTELDAQVGLKAQSGIFERTKYTRR